MPALLPEMIVFLTASADDDAHTLPPSAPASLPSMELLNAVRVLACTYNPPPRFAAVLLLADTPWMSVMEADNSVYTPPPLFASLPSMELFNAVRVLASTYPPTHTPSSLGRVE